MRNRFLGDTGARPPVYERPLRCLLQSAVSGHILIWQDRAGLGECVIQIAAVQKLVQSLRKDGSQKVRTGNLSLAYSSNLLDNLTLSSSAVSPYERVVSFGGAWFRRAG